MAKKKPTTKSKKDNKKKRKILLATLIPVGALVAATAITVPLVLAKRNNENVNIQLVDCDDGVKVSSYDIKTGKESSITLELTSRKVIKDAKVVIDGKELKEDTDYTYDDNTINIKATAAKAGEIKLTIHIQDFIYKHATVITNIGESEAKIGFVPAAETDIKIQYSTTGEENDWQDMPDGSSEWAAIPVGGKIFLRGNNNNYLSDENNRSKFVEEGSAGEFVPLNISGSIMGLLDNAGANKKEASWKMPDYCFYYLFNSFGGLTTVDSKYLSAKELKTLSKGCYAYMFNYCNKLASAPALPATKLAESCYCDMFYGCTNLASAPALPATELAKGCYQEMFYGCEAITQAPKLPATKLADYCYSNMFSNCTKLEFAPKLMATELAEYCYEYMFDTCVSLVAPPTLPATTLKSYCYYGMFARCKFTTAPILQATTLAENCYEGMFQECEELKVAPSLPVDTLKRGCYSSMFQECKGLTVAPALQAKTLVEGCYEGMFRDCGELKQAPILPATTLVNKCYYNMFFNCAKLKIVDAGEESSTQKKIFECPDTEGLTNPVTNMFTYTKDKSYWDAEAGKTYYYIVQE